MGNDRWTALHNFWSSFGIPAYDETTVPSSATYPRLTYEAGISFFDEGNVLNASLWYYSTSWAEISQKAEEISNVIGDGGVLQPYAGGTAWITRGRPFAQRMSDPEPNLRRIVLTINTEFLS